MAGILLDPGLQASNIREPETRISRYMNIYGVYETGDWAQHN